MWLNLVFYMGFYRRAISEFPGLRTRDAPITLFYKTILLRVFLFVYLPIPILLRFGLHESAINLEADFILSSADYVKPIVQNYQKAIPSQKYTELSGFNKKKAFKQTISSH